VYDEIFFDFDGEAFNQNWLGFGFSYKTSNKVKLKFGYQKISLNNNTDFDRLLLGIVLSTDHRTKK
jgi:long-subunit fatty acid transport protein